MIDFPAFTDQIDTSGLTSLFTPVSRPTDISTTIPQPIVTTPSVIAPPPRVDRQGKPVLGMASFLKSKFFGRKLPTSDSNHRITGVGVVIGVEKIENTFYFNMHAVDSDQQFRAKVVFEKDLFGISFRDAAIDQSTRNAARLDMEQRINSGIGPLLEQAPADSSTSSSSQPPASSVILINSLNGEDTLYYNQTSQSFLPATLVFFKGKPYFKEDGSLVFIRAEIVP